MSAPSNDKNSDLGTSKVTKGKVDQKTKAVSSLAKDIEETIKQEFENKLKDLNNFQDVYHAIHSIIEKLNEKQGAMQLKLPTKKDLKEQYDHHCRGNKVDKDKLSKIMSELITLEKVSVGKSAMSTIFFIFGAPIVSLFLKKFIPGGGSISDDIFLPLVTSGTVLGLAGANML